ncbi:MAG: hypothetical protein LQ341_006928 [Variospora aurantia]|nr:MAG: hypothetical protein LQ341_006928 [Variospora aurantia]
MSAGLQGQGANGIREFQEDGHWRGEPGGRVRGREKASSPSEITPDMIEEEFHPRQEQKQAFARPKRPGKN